MTADATNVVVCNGKATARHSNSEGTIFLEIGRHDKDRAPGGNINGLYVAFPAEEKHAAGLAGIFKRCAPNHVHFDSITLGVLRVVQPPLYHLIIGEVIASLWNPGMASVAEDPFLAIDLVIPPCTIAGAYNAAHAAWMDRYGGRPRA